MSNEKVVIKVGRNVIEAVLMETMPDGSYMVMSAKGKEFKVRKIERIASEPVKKLSLLDAAYEVLKSSTQPMNTKELVAKAVELGLWSPSGGKTPEQSLYGAIFTELRKDAPRFRKSAVRKGAFEIVR